MGDMIEFPSNGSTGGGYLAVPDSGSGTAVVVIQEWWGLVPHITEVADRFAGEGFSALAPDLYHGSSAPNSEPDEAGKLMMAMELDRAGKDLSGAVDEIVRRTGRDKVGVVGFCMGGGLALVLACQRPDKVAACVPFYGAIPWPDAQPDFGRLGGPVLSHVAEDDGWFGPDAAAAQQDAIEKAGKRSQYHVYPGTEHAFFNDTRPEVFDADAAALAWTRTIDFLRTELG